MPAGVCLYVVVPCQVDRFSLRPPSLFIQKYATTSMVETCTPPNVEQARRPGLKSWAIIRFSSSGLRGPAKSDEVQLSTTAVHLRVLAEPDTHLSKALFTALTSDG